MTGKGERDGGETRGTSRPARESNRQRRLGTIAHTECSRELPSMHPPNQPLMLSAKQGGIGYHFYRVFGMTRPGGANPQPPGLRADTLPQGHWAGGLVKLSAQICSTSNWAWSFDFPCFLNPSTPCISLLHTSKILTSLITFLCHMFICCANTFDFSTQLCKSSIWFDLV